MKPFDRGGLAVLLPRLGRVRQACGASVWPSAVCPPQNTFTAPPILLSLMRETAAARGLVTQEPGKSVAWGALSSPPVMHNAGHIYNVGGYPVQMSARTNTGHMLGSRISWASPTHPLFPLGPT